MFSTNTAAGKSYYYLYMTYQLAETLACIVSNGTFFQNTAHTLDGGDGSSKDDRGHSNSAY